MLGATAAAATGLVGTVQDLLIPLLGVTATGVVGWFAHNYRRKLQLELSGKRLDAYAGLWEVTGIAAPTRLDGRGVAGYLRPDERWRLWRAMTEWYYQNGNGLLLDDASKSVYLQAKHNLACRTDELEPEDLRSLVQEELRRHDGDHGTLDVTYDDVVRGLLAISQLSLLRTQLKSDLRIYGQTYAGRLLWHEIVFLQGCGVKLDSRPWAKASRWYRLGTPGAPTTSPWGPPQRLIDGRTLADFVPRASMAAIGSLLDRPAAPTAATGRGQPPAGGRAS